MKYSCVYFPDNGDIEELIFLIWHFSLVFNKLFSFWVIQNKPLLPDENLIQIFFPFEFTFIKLFDDFAH